MRSFSINQGKDTIQFIKVDSDIKVKKPVLLFCQGSLPIPLIIKDKEGMIIPALNNFDYKKIAEKYHIIVISMPCIPIMPEEEHLNNQYCYIEDSNNSHSFPLKYSEANFLDNYVKRANRVIKFLRKQTWVDKSRMLIVGHSQGTYIATKVAAENPAISALGFLSGNPLGRVSEYIWQYRKLEHKGAISPKEAQERIDGIYEWWKNINLRPSNKPLEPDKDSSNATISFSTPVIEDLLNLSIPIYIAYGTEDNTSFYCDFLPIEFIRKGKINYKIRPYVGLEHNFMEVDSAGKPIVEKMHWTEVFNDFIKWTETEIEK